MCSPCFAFHAPINSSLADDVEDEFPPSPVEFVETSSKKLYFLAQESDFDMYIPKDCLGVIEDVKTVKADKVVYLGDDNQPVLAGIGKRKRWAPLRYWEHERVVYAKTGHSPFRASVVGVVTGRGDREVVCGVIGVVCSGWGVRNS